jgi:hypothetical protein
MFGSGFVSGQACCVSGAIAVERLNSVELRRSSPLESFANLALMFVCKLFSHDFSFPALTTKAHGVKLLNKGGDRAF